MPPRAASAEGNSGSAGTLGRVTQPAGAHGRAVRWWIWAWTCSPRPRAEGTGGSSAERLAIRGAGDGDEGASSSVPRWSRPVTVCGQPSSGTGSRLSTWREAQQKEASVSILGLSCFPEASPETCNMGFQPTPGNGGLEGKPLCGEAAPWVRQSWCGAPHPARQVWGSAATPNCLYPLSAAQGPADQLWALPCTCRRG